MMATVRSSMWTLFTFEYFYMPPTHAKKVFGGGGVGGWRFHCECHVSRPPPSPKFLDLLLDAILAKSTVFGITVHPPNI